MKKISLIEIAKLADVSQPTVSAILSNNKNNNTKFSKITAKKVRKIADDYNYRPSRTLRTLFEKKHNSIGLLAKNINMIPHDSMNSVINNASKNNQTVLIDTFKENDELPNTIREDIVDGLLIFEDLGKMIDAAIDKYEIPAVYVNTNKYDCNALTVNIDEKEAMHQAADLFSKSNKKRTLLLLQGDSSYTQLRATGIKEACITNEPVILIITENSANKDSYKKTVFQKIKSILINNPDIDSIISGWDITSNVVYEVCQSMNKRIPEDIAVLSLYDVSGHWQLYPEITSLYVDYSEMANKGMELLNKIINKLKCSDIILKYKLMEGESV